MPGVNNTWTCHSPESCRCQWNATYGLLELTAIGCKEMGNLARVGLYAPSMLVPYVSLPSSIGGSTGYYSATTINGTSSWVSTAISGYTPTSIGPMTTYSTPAPTSIVLIYPDGTPVPSTYPAAHSLNATVLAAIQSGNPKTVSPTSTSSQTTSTLSTSAPATSSTTPSPTPTSSSGLSTGEKIGIGVGVAGFVCLLAAVAIVAWLMGRRKRNKVAEQQQPAQQAPEAYSDKPAGWDGSHYGAAPPYGYQHSPRFSEGSPYYGSPPGRYEAPSPPMEQMAFKREAGSPPPMELEGQHGAQEMDSRAPSVLPERGTTSPAPAYRSGDDD